MRPVPKIISAPSVEPVTLERLRRHLRLPADQTAEDDDLEESIVAARQEAEHLTGRALAPQTLEIALDAWPADGIELRRPPLVSVTWLKYVDLEGVERTVDPADYALDTHQEPAWLVPVYDALWPLARDQANAIQVRYVAGYPEGQCPALIRRWILLRAGTLFEFRNADADRPVEPHQFAVRLLDGFTPEVL